MKILFIRFSSIGDIVLTTPVIRCVKQQLQNAEIHFLLKKQFAPVLEHNQYIDKKHYFDDNFSETLSLLKKEKFDAIVDLQRNFRSLKFKLLLGKKSYTFNKLNFRKWLLVNFRINTLPDVHIVDRYMKSVAALGVKNDGQGLDYFLSSMDEEAVNRLPHSHRENYIAWVIGAKHFTKRLPMEKMISISRKINTPIVLLGGQEDDSTGSELASSNPEKIFNACGKFSLNESAAIVKHSRQIITHDTGLMHIAAAFNKEIISIWGNTIPKFGMYPYLGANPIPIAIGTKTQNSFILEVTGLPCRPCSKIGFEKCPKGHFKCMKEIDESVFENL